MVYGANPREQDEQLLPFHCRDCIITPDPTQRRAYYARLWPQGLGDEALHGSSRPVEASPCQASHHMGHCG